MVADDTSVQDLRDGCVGAGLSNLHLSDVQQLVQDHENVPMAFQSRE